MNFKLSFKAVAASVTQSEHYMHMYALVLGEATFGDSGGYRCELALGGDRPWVEHIVVVKEPKMLTNNALQHYELVQKEATTVTATELLLQKEVTSAEEESATERNPPIDESGTLLPPIHPLFTSPSTRWSPKIISTFTIYETSQAPQDSPKDSPTPIPPIFLNIPAEGSEYGEREDERKVEEYKDGSDYIEDANGTDEDEDNSEANEEYDEGILDELMPEPHSPITSKVATTSPPDKQDRQEQDNEKEEDWPALPPLITSSKTPFILVTPSSENIVEEEDVEERLSSDTTLGPSSTSSSSTVHVAPSSAQLPVSVDEPSSSHLPVDANLPVSVDGPDPSSGHLLSSVDEPSSAQLPVDANLPSSVDEPSLTTHQPLSVDGPEEEVRLLLDWPDVCLC